MEVNDMDTDIIFQVLTIFQQNPILLGLLISVIRNIGGYLTECFTQHKIVQYQGAKLLETFTLYETFFVAAGQVGGLSNGYTVILAVAVDIVRSLKKGVITAKQTPV
jgi:hypothetical protein